MSTDAAADNPTREGNYMPKGPSVNGHTAQGGGGGVLHHSFITINQFSYDNELTLTYPVTQATKDYPDQY